MLLFDVRLREEVCPVLLKPAKFSARRRDWIVIREAAIMAKPGSISVQTMAVVPAKRMSE
jgi:hypothetical protein